MGTDRRATKSPIRLDTDGAPAMILQAERDLRDQLADSGHELALLLTFAAVRQAPTGQLMLVTSLVRPDETARLTGHARERIAEALRQAADALEGVAACA